jgi:hypothetical protein
MSKETGQNGLENDPLYQSALEIVQQKIIQYNPPYIFLPGRSAIQLGRDLLELAERNGQAIETKLYGFPISSDTIPLDIYAEGLISQVIQVRDVLGGQVIFLEDYMMYGAKFRAIIREAAKNGIEPHFWVISSWYFEEYVDDSPPNVEVILPGERELILQLGRRVGYPHYAEDVILPEGFPQEIGLLPDVDMF